MYIATGSPTHLLLATVQLIATIGQHYYVAQPQLEVSYDSQAFQNTVTYISLLAYIVVQVC